MTVWEIENSIVQFLNTVLNIKSKGTWNLRKAAGRKAEWKAEKKSPEMYVKLDVSVLFNTRILSQNYRNVFFSNCKNVIAYL